MAGHFHTWNSFHSPEHLSRISPHYQRSTGFVPWCSFPWTWHLVSLHLLAPLSRFNQGRRQEHVSQRWSLRLLLLFWNEAECWRFWRSPASRRFGNKIPTKSCCNIDLVMESERETDMEESINRLGLLCNCTFPQWSTSKQTHYSKREKKSPPTLKHTCINNEQKLHLPGSTWCPPANTEQVGNGRLKDRKRKKTAKKPGLFLQMRSTLEFQR